MRTSAVAAGLNIPISSPASEAAMAVDATPETAVVVGVPQKGATIWEGHELTRSIGFGRSNRLSKQTNRDEVQKVSGVEKDAQECIHNGALPIALRTTDNRVVVGTYTTPITNDLGLDHLIPALLGFKTLTKQRAILDLHTMQLSCTGPEEPGINFSLRTDTFQLTYLLSGHLMLSCCEYQRAIAKAGRVGVTEKELSSVTSSTSASSSSRQ